MTALTVQCTYTKCWCAIRLDLELHTENERLRARVADLERHAGDLCEIARMPNVEFVADAHNAAVKAIRDLARNTSEQGEHL